MEGEQVPLAAQRIAVQLPRAHCINTIKKRTTSREAVGWNELFGNSSAIVRMPAACADHTGMGSFCPFHPI
jgi:hypothetical protein